MKAKYVWVALLALTFFGCDDNTGTLGLGMLPESDQNINGRYTTYEVSTNSILSGPVYAKTSVGYVGKFTDKEFGAYEASFLAQLNSPSGISFPSVYDPEKNPKGVMAGDSIHTAELILYYKSYFGDSISPCRMTVYKLNAPLPQLPQTYYTNIKPELYYSSDSLLAQKAYTAVDQSLSDSIRNSDNFYPNVRLTSKEITKLGKRIYRLNRDHPEYFKSSEAFIENVFKGIYAKNDYGNGTILYVDQINLNVVIRCHEKDSLGNNLKKKNGTDSLYYTTRTFATTKEVIQANSFNTSQEELQGFIDKHPECTYLKSPAGIFTQATLPIDDIYKELSNDTINAVKLTFNSYNQPDNGQFSMKAPTYVLLLREKERQSFFEENKLTDNITSYLAVHNAIISNKPTTNQYVFTNLTRLINTCVNEKQEAKKKAGSSWNETAWEAKNPDWNKVVLIPVLVQYDSSSNKNMISIQHDLQPGYVKLEGGPGINNDGTKLKLEVTYTNFNGKQ
ncbi:DUF4270 domain-containing protein [Bacteroides fragilis]|uniref:DUF4270 domain-containing protein n=1 Tax=Bacteroides fragilis TaxID=817 RepID=UPI001C6FE8E1|nr:DUF4270 domain-containing protein [Bacteroides fragilis]MBW9277766.1 DUF4270 domain-containing protein [Bacteroides fragilis]